MTSTSLPPIENGQQSVQNRDVCTPPPETEDSDDSSPQAKRSSTCSPPAVEVYSAILPLPPNRRLRRYSTSCPPPAKHQKFYLPNYSTYSREEAKESILTGSLFRPIPAQGAGESEEDDDSFTTGSSSHVSVDSAYSSDAAKKSSGSVAAPSTSEENGGSVQPSKLGCRRKIQAKLHCKTLWRTFLNIGNEMIVTKPGR